MNTFIERLQEQIEPLRKQIINHKVYGVISNTQDLKTFMEYHVYAVWDFMSLLKALQINLTCTTIPWYPKGDAETRFLINEIVVGEESDEDQNGVRKSHFELYLDAMKQCGADVAGISVFNKTLQQSGDFNTAYLSAGTPVSARNFVDYTFKIIDSNRDYLQAAIFTFGREDLIPGMFLSIINDMHQSEPESISIFKYYLDRHIEVDGGHHSHLALQMTANLCGNNPQFWNEATLAVTQSLHKRIALWDGAYVAISANSKQFSFSR